MANLDELEKQLKEQQLNFYDVTDTLNVGQNSKKFLLNEFRKKKTSAELHEELMKRKQKSQESIQQYFYAISEIASYGDISNYQFRIDK